MLQNWHSSKYLYTKLKVVSIGYIEWWHVQLLCHARKGKKNIVQQIQLLQSCVFTNPASSNLEVDNCPTLSKDMQ